MNYTKEQRDIFKFVSSGNGHGIIDAVAGAGKTTTIIESTAYVPPGNRILFCAFNNSIASEIARKFHSKGMNAVVVKTIHALGFSILRVNNQSGKPYRLENNKYNNLIKSESIDELLAPHFKKIVLINKLDPENTSDKRNAYAVKSLLFLIKSRLIDINQKYRSTLCEDDFAKFKALVTHFGIFNSLESQKEKFDQEIREYYLAHKLILEQGNDLSRESQIIDFTDMLYLPYEWKFYPVHTFDFLFIDECQDLSRSQLAVALKFAKSSSRVLAVGDPKQSIYGFTGADIQSFDRVKNKTNASPLPLTTCFRCPEGVIEIAQQFRSDIRGNKEYAGVVSEIRPDEVIALAQANDLIISRLRAPILLLVFSFIDKEIKVKIHEDEAADFINELKKLFKQPERQRTYNSYPGGFEAIKHTVQKRHDFIIEKNAERIVNALERQQFIISEKAFLSQKLEFLHKKSIKWSNDCHSIEDILKKIHNYITSNDNPINLSTIHRAKGLEADRVFILDYDKLPHSRLEIMDWEIIQESNLKYVAVTRAKEELYLVKSEKVADPKDEGNLFDDLF